MYIYMCMYRVYVSCTTYIPNPTPIPTSRIPALMAFTISSYFAGFDRRQVRSTTETSGVGTRKAILGSDQWRVTLWLCQNSELENGHRKVDFPIFPLIAW